MKHLDLFSGIGGFALAARWAKIETLLFCEIDSFCKKVLNKNFPTVPIHDDIKTLTTLPHADIITAGFPCQPFSIAGKQKGKEDKRYLWPELLRIIKHVKSPWVVIENVTGIVAMELDNILTDLEKENYSTRSFIIPACAANAPHRRDRLWIIANLNSERHNMWIDCYRSGFLPENKERHMAALYQEWEKLKPDAWQTLRAEHWLKNNANFERAHDGLSARMDKARIKSLGNSIVPQIAYVILAGINNLHLINHRV